jgi:hypothetical protein
MRGEPSARSLRIVLCWFQGIYYFITGAWPILSIRTFQWVTGPKTDHLPTGRESDHWLVMAVSVLIVAIACTLLFAARRRSQAPEVTVLAILAALGLTSIDIVYVARGVIAPIYLLDAGIEIPLILAWSVVAVRDLHWLHFHHPEGCSRSPVR